MRTMATCDIKQDGDRVILDVAGELTLASAYPMLSALQRAAPLADECAVDLHAVKTITPGGWEALEEVLEAARALFRDVALIPSHSV
jgi:ABC-type transporter Mla MlaB component